MSVLTVTTPRGGFAREDVVDSRYVLVERLDDDDPSERSAVWHARDELTGTRVVIDLMPAAAKPLPLESVLARIGLDQQSVLGTGPATGSGRDYVYVVSTLPVPRTAVTAPAVA